MMRIFSTLPPRIPSRPIYRAGRAQSGFSLIELLTVVAIIAILAALLLQTAGYVQDKAARSRTEAEIQALSTALESYKADNGDYPRKPPGTPATDGGTDSSRTLITDLCPPTGSGKIYFEIPATMLSAYSKGTAYGTALTNSANSGRLIDAYGNPYRYQYPGNANRSGTAFFDLYSTGKRPTLPSGTPQATWEKQWITNWAN